jgi:hypothetical protein
MLACVSSFCRPWCTRFVAHRSVSNVGNLSSLQTFVHTCHTLLRIKCWKSLLPADLCAHALLHTFLHLLLEVSPPCRPWCIRVAHFYVSTVGSVKPKLQSAVLENYQQPTNGTICFGYSNHNLLRLFNNNLLRLFKAHFWSKCLALIQRPWSVPCKMTGSLLLHWFKWLHAKRVRGFNALHVRCRLQTCCPHTIHYIL